MWLCQHDKLKTPDRNDLKLGTLVVLKTVSKPIDSGLGLWLGSGAHLDLQSWERVHIPSCSSMLLLFFSIDFLIMTQH